jgi:hypothetical protein
MNKTKFFPPYYKSPRGADRCTIKECKHCSQSGVYFIKSNRSGKIVYVGQSQTQLKKTIYRHFQAWTDRSRRTGKHFERKTYPNRYGYMIRFIKCTPAQALRLEMYYIQKLKPRDNPLKYEMAFGADEKERIKPLISALNDSTFLSKKDFIEEDAPF